MEPSLMRCFRIWLLATLSHHITMWGSAVVSNPSISAEDFPGHLRPLPMPRPFSSNYDHDGRWSRPGQYAGWQPNDLQMRSLPFLSHISARLVVGTRIFYLVSLRPSASSACRLLAPGALPTCPLSHSLLPACAGQAWNWNGLWRPLLRGHS